MARWFLVLVAFALGPALQLFAEGAAWGRPQDVYELTATIVSEEGDIIAHGESYTIGPTRDVYVLIYGTSVATSGIEEIIVQTPIGFFHEFTFKFSTFYQQTPLQTGSYPAQFFGEKVSPLFQVFTPVTKPGECATGTGVFTISAADFEKGEDNRWAVNKFAVAFEGICGGASGGVKGTLTVQLVDDSGEGGGGGGNEPPVPPPPPPPTYVKIVAPPSGVSLGNSEAATIAISTTVHEGYEGPVHLEAYGPPGLEVSFEPQMIPPPGAGTSAMTIEVGEHVLPMRHLVEIRASGPPRPTSIVFPVELLCEPPFVSYAGLPSSTIVGAGGTTTLKIDVVGSAPLRYQWYEGPTGSIWRPIQNAKGSSLTVGPVNGTSFYWLRVTNGCGSWDSPTLRVGNSGPRWRPVR